MKVTEILSETVSGAQAGEIKAKRGKLQHSHDKAIPDMTSYPDIPGMYYGMYRFGIQMAGAPENPPHEQGPSANDMVTIAYTDVEADIINHTAKTMGLKKRPVSSKGSKESDDTHHTSPVAKPKRNKYGV